MMKKFFAMALVSSIVLSMSLNVFADSITQDNALSSEELLSLNDSSQLDGSSSVDIYLENPDESMDTSIDAVQFELSSDSCNDELNINNVFERRTADSLQVVAGEKTHILNDDYRALEETLAPENERKTSNSLQAVAGQNTTSINNDYGVLK